MQQKTMSKEESQNLLDEILAQFPFFEAGISGPQYTHHVDRADEIYHWVWVRFGRKDQYGITRHLLFQHKEEWEDFLVLVGKMTAFLKVGKSIEH